MSDFPRDIYTEPEPDADTLANLGPLTGMVIFRPHCVSRSGRNVPETSKTGNWYALRPAEVRSFARALLDAADSMDLKAKMLQAAKTAAAG